MPIRAEDTEETVGTLSGILLHPDRGTVEGFFVHTPGFFSSSSSFLSAYDVAHFGRFILVRDHDRIAAPADFLRAQPLLRDPRTVLGQRIQSESGFGLGRCRDVQFETSSMRLEWLFPRKWWRWRDPISARDIVEVRPDAIIVRDAPAMAKEKQAAAEPTLVSLIPDVPNSA